MCVLYAHVCVVSCVCVFTREKFPYICCITFTYNADNCLKEKRKQAELKEGSLKHQSARQTAKLSKLISTHFPETSMSLPSLCCVSLCFVSSYLLQPFQCWAELVLVRSPGLFTISLRAPLVCSDVSPIPAEHSPFSCSPPVASSLNHGTLKCETLWYKNAWVLIDPGA